MSDRPVAPAPAAVPASLVWLPPLASAVLLYLCFFPVALGGLAWVALLPWLALVRLPGQPRHLYLAAWLGGVAFFLPVLQWARVADPRMYVTWIALSLYCACYFPLALFLLRRIERQTTLPLILAFPVVWVVLEHFRWGFIGSYVSLLSGSHQHDIPGGFSWYLLGHTQHDFLELIQFADTTGVYGVSFLVAAVNALLFEVVVSRPTLRRWLPDDFPPPRRVGLLAQGLLVAALLLGALFYGTMRLREGADLAPGPALAILQTNVDQRLRNLSSLGEDDDRHQAQQAVVRQVDEVSRLAHGRRLDLVLTPETSYPGTWGEFSPGRPTGPSRLFALDRAVEFGTSVLLGLNSYVYEADGKGHGYNSAVLVGPDGAWLGRYDKVHRVPFGEYIPVRNLLPFLNYFAPYDSDYTVAPGRAFTRFALPERAGGHTFGVVICYEDTDAAMARAYVSGADRPVDFLVNISNDGWFDGSSEHDQHLAICRFRAIECRRSLARSVNMGISAVIDSSGRVLAPRERERQDGGVLWEVPAEAGSLPIGRWHEFKKVGGVLLARVPIDGRMSLYARWGDAFAGLCWLTLLGVLLVGQVRPRQEKS